MEGLLINQAPTTHERQSFRTERKTNPVIEFYRCPEERLQNGIPAGDLSGLTSLRRTQNRADLPLSTAEMVESLRLERYPMRDPTSRAVLSSEAARRIYYFLRPALPDQVRKRAQRAYFSNWETLSFPKWPVDTSVETLLEQSLVASLHKGQQESIPFIWFWPDGASAAVIMTHDVEAVPGLNFIPQLMALDEEFDIRASFQLVPEHRYPVSEGLLASIRNRDFEINVHGLNHEGNLFSDRKKFLKQADLIRHYVKAFGARGFRSSCMYRNLDWFADLGVLYDMSVPNVAHLEPQRGGCCTIFPYFIGDLVELPLTTIQDYSLLHILGQYSIRLWKKQIDLILDKHGLISFIIHPDYLLEERAFSVYRSLLAYLQSLRREKNVWIALPGQVQQWWRERQNMELVMQGGSWRIVGPGSERACVCFARLNDEKVVDYTLQDVRNGV